MSNSDDDSSHASSSDEDSEKNPGINLTSFLFGNIDRDGKLEDDGNFLDETSKKKLGGLSTVLGLKSIIEEETNKTANEPKNKDEDYEEGSKVKINTYTKLNTMYFSFREFGGLGPEQTCKINRRIYTFIRALKVCHWVNGKFLKLGKFDFFVPVLFSMLKYSQNSLWICFKYLHN